MMVPGWTPQVQAKRERGPGSYIAEACAYIVTVAQCRTDDLHSHGFGWVVEFNDECTDAMIVFCVTDRETHTIIAHVATIT